MDNRKNYDAASMKLASSVINCSNKSIVYLNYLNIYPQIN